MTEPQTWRAVIALLVNPDARTATALLLLGDDIAAATAGLTEAKREKIAGLLRSAGLVGPDDRFTDAAVRALLADRSGRPAGGVHRFLSGQRITTYPANQGERLKLLKWVADAAFVAGEQLAETAVNDRLRPYDDDVAVLRRYLVDSGLLRRSRDGERYERL